jgi:putative PEP-CTERM system TPR-repeat lipoprotein
MPDLTRRALTAILLLGLAACNRDPAQASRHHLARGDGYAAKGQYAEAIVEYRRSVQLDPRSGTARLQLAEAYRHADKLEDAYREYLRAAERLPGNTGVQVAAGNILLVAGRFDDAKEIAETILARNPGYVEAQVLLGNALAGLKQVDRAIAEIERAIRLDPSRSPTHVTLGTLQRARGQRDLAEAAFKRAVEAGPNSADAALALGTFYWSVGDTQNAEGWLRQAAQLGPRHLLAARALASFLIVTNRTEEAEAPLQRLVQTTGAVTAKLALADYYIDTNAPERAEHVLTGIGNGEQGYDAVQLRLASVDYAAGRRTQAHAAVDAALARSPRNVELLLLKARFLRGDGRLDAARDKARSAAAIDSTSIPARYALGVIEADLNQHEDAIDSFNEVLRLDPRVVPAQLQLARLHLAGGDAQRAVQLAQDALRMDPQSGDARLLLAQGLLARGDPDRAQAALGPLLAESPTWPSPYVEAGRAALLQKDLAAAARAFSRALELDALSVDALAGLVTVDVVSGRSAEARTRIEQRLRRTPDDPDLLVLAARTYAALGDLPAAEGPLLRALQRDPTRLQAYGMLGGVYLNEGRLDEARTHFDAMAAREPNATAAHTMVAVILQIQGRLPEAIARYRRAIELDSRAAVAANNLAWLYAEGHGTLDAALDLALSARAQLPQQPEVNDTLGWIYCKRGQADEALAALRRSVEKEPSNALYRYHLGRAYLLADQRGKAKSELERALRLRPDFGGAADARRALASITTDETVRR